MPGSTPVHIIGLGSIGSFLAHSIRALPNPPPVNLLIHRKNLYDEFASKGWTLGLRVNEDGRLQEQGGFDAELLSQSTSSEPIQNLIVAVKASATVSALQPIQHRLGPQSTICLFQNGMGQIENLNERVFTDKARRPTYMFGIMRHGVYLRSPTEAILSGSNGRAAIGVVDVEEDLDTSSRRANPQFLLDTLLRSPILRCEELAWKELLQNQLFKLAANCVLNPLTAILDVKNGVIKENSDLQPLIQRLLQEISLVFRSLPEIKDLPSDQKDRFSVSSLEALVMDTIEKTAGNSSSMREDVRKGRATEIEYINGWILRRARELGIECEANAGLMQLVLAKSRLSMERRE
jgi:2-dehydropantoate 2-reductase